MNLRLREPFDYDPVKGHWTELQGSLSNGSRVPVRCVAFDRGGVFLASACRAAADVGITVEVWDMLTVPVVVRVLKQRNSRGGRAGGATGRPGVDAGTHGVSVIPPAGSSAVPAKTGAGTGAGTGACTGAGGEAGAGSGMRTNVGTENVTGDSTAGDPVHLCWSKDSRKLLVVNQLGAVTIWNVESGRVVASLRFVVWQFVTCFALFRWLQFVPPM